MSLRSSLGKVEGLGAAKEGAHHWWAQRVSSVALVLLTLWFVASLVHLGSYDYGVVHSWLAKSINTVLMLLLATVAIYHSQLGVQVVVEDYVNHHGAKLAVLMLVNFVHLLLAALAAFAILRVAFGAST
jgi:succinate dehydrogenase / fumarate reductase, membrane anchor subunit